MEETESITDNPSETGINLPKNDSNNNDKKKSPPKKKIRIIHVLFSLVVVFAIFLFYWYFYASVSFERMFSKGMANLAEFQTFQFEGNLKIDYFDDYESLGLRIKEGDLRDLGPFSKPGGYYIDFSGSVDISDFENIRYLSAVDVRMDENRVIFELLRLGSAVYFNVEEIYDFGSHFNEFKDRWIKYDLEKTANDNKYSLNIPSFLSGKTDFHLLGVILSGNIPVRSGEKPKKVKIGSENTLLFEFDVDKQNLLETVKTYSDFKGQPELYEDMAESLSNVEFSNGRVWISRKNMHILKITANIRITNDDLSGTFEDYAFDLRIKNINEPVEINPPYEWILLEDFISDIYFGY